MHDIWRRTASLPPEGFRDKINNVVSISPPHGIDKVNILLMGGVGSGKSSFVSSVDSVFENRISRVALSGKKMNAAPVTQCSRKYDFYRDGELCFSIWDTPGWTDTTQEVYFSQMQAIISSGASISDTAHVLVLFVPCNYVTEGYVAQLRKVKDQANDCGLPVIFFLTKIGGDFGIPNNFNLLQYSRFFAKLTRVVEYLSERLGVPPNHIIPVRNYRTEYEASQDTGAFVLLGLQAALDTAIDGLKDNAHLWTNQVSPLTPEHVENTSSTWQSSERGRSNPEGEGSLLLSHSRVLHGEESESEDHGVVTQAGSPKSYGEAELDGFLAEGVAAAAVGRGRGGSGVRGRGQQGSQAQIRIAGLPLLSAPLLGAPNWMGTLRNGRPNLCRFP